MIPSSHSKSREVSYCASAPSCVLVKYLFLPHARLPDSFVISTITSSSSSSSSESAGPRKQELQDEYLLGRDIQVHNDGKARRLQRARLKAIREKHVIGQPNADGDDDETTNLLVEIWPSILNLTERIPLGSTKWLSSRAFQTTLIKLLHEMTSFPRDCEGGPFSCEDKGEVGALGKHRKTSNDE